MARILRSERIYSTIGAILHALFVALPLDLFDHIFCKPKSVRNQTIVITGAASGIGQKLALLFGTQLGANVALLDVNHDGVRKTAEQVVRSGGIAKWWVCDISDVENLQRCAHEIQIAFGDVDIVICNAAILFFGSILDLSNLELQKSMDVNLLGTINTIRAFLKPMEKRNRGHIVAISSIAGFFGEVNGVGYCASKFAIRGVMESLQMEMVDRGLTGIRVTTVFPYFTRTPMILNANMRPTSIWIPFLSVDRCAREILDAILREKVLAFIPHYISILVMLKNVLPSNVYLAGRKYLNCRYKPSSQNFNSDYIRLSGPNDFLQKLETNLRFTILAFYATLWAYWYHICACEKNLTCLVIVLVPLIHIFAAIYSLFISHQLNFSFLCTYQWFIKITVFGLPSLMQLQRYKQLQNNTHKNHNHDNNNNNDDNNNDNIIDNDNYNSKLNVFDNNNMNTRKNDQYSYTDSQLSNQSH